MSSKMKDMGDTRVVWREQEISMPRFIPSLYRFVGIKLHYCISISVAFLYIVSRHVQLFLGHLISFFKPKRKNTNSSAETTTVNSSVSGFISFYTQWFYNPMSDCWNRPVLGPASKTINVRPRTWVRDEHGNDLLVVNSRAVPQHCINMGSYNYLGYGGPCPSVTPYVCEAIERSGVVSPSTACEMGITAEQRDLEVSIASFLGKEDAVVVPMGFATNSLILPALVGPRCLVLSDDLNHSSLVTGLRTSSATVRLCGHNDLRKLEAMLRVAVREVPRWRRILIVVEGVYSMEGEVCPLPGIVKLAKHYGALTYIDEAHSIGALGRHGRGVCDYYGVDPKDVDILMGTFTKSFGSVGGYIAASHKVIAMLRRRAPATMYGATMAPGCAAQITRVLAELGRPEGSAPIEKLRANSILMRKRLSEAGCTLLGQDDSPVIPIVIPHPWKLCLFSRECLHRGVATVVVGYPATSLMGLRARLCMSAAFETKEVEDVARTIASVVKGLEIDFSASKHPKVGSDKHVCCKDDNSCCDYISEPFTSDDHGECAYERKIRVIDPMHLPRIVLSGHDYLGLFNTQRAVKASVAAVSAYGCGSCGPRGFYGTMDKHLELEERLAKWLGMEASILYSYGTLASTSAIPPFASSPADVVVYDECVSMALRTGISLCKGAKYVFPHNNMSALRTLLVSIKSKENSEYSSRNKEGVGSVQWLSALIRTRPRHIIVTEGIFSGTGDIAPLPELVALKREFGYLLFVDETYSIGTLGSTGLGIRQYWAEKTCSPSLMADKYIVDLLIGSLEPTLGSIGGFCAGPRKLVQHQVLNAIGYVFSASSPPYLCAAACCAIDELESSPRKRLVSLRGAVRSLRDAFETELSGLYDISGSSDSPMAFISLRSVLFKEKRDHGSGARIDEMKVLERVEDGCWRDGIAVCVARFSEKDEGRPSRPSLRLCASVKYMYSDYVEAFRIISKHTTESIKAVN